jgi:hypothetical protein
MKKSELKKTLKPVIKECIQEMLIEEGLLSGIVSEVVKGLGSAPLVETTREAPGVNVPSKESRTHLKEQREKLIQAVSRDAYNGVNVFEGTEPLSSYETSSPGSKGPDLGDPRDAGVDISSIMGQSSQIWKALK